MSTAEALVPTSPVIEMDPVLELPPISPEERTLLDALTPPADLLQRWQSEFERIAENVATSQLKPFNQQLIREAADTIRWEWFGAEGDTLPSCLALFVRGNEIDYTYHPKSHAAEFGGITAQTEELKKHLALIIEEREAYFENNFDQITEALAGVIGTSRLHDFLKSFLIEAPNVVNQPLTPSWRRVRESQIEQEVRRTYGVADGDHIPARSMADLALRKGLYQLDDETMPRQHEQQVSAFDRVNAWVLDAAQHWLSKDAVERGERIVKIVPQKRQVEWVDKAGNKSIMVNGELLMQTDAGTEETIDDELHDWSYDLYQELPGSTLDDQRHSHFLVAHFVRQIYMGEHAGDVAMSLSDAVWETTLSEIDDMLYGNEPNSTNLMKLRRPASSGPIFDGWPHQGKVNKRRVELDKIEEQIGIVSAELMEKDYKRTTGWVTHRHHEGDGMRLIIVQNRESDRDLYDDESDLVITFSENSQFGPARVFASEPYIPGYVVTAYDEGYRWYFRREDNDPYQNAELITFAPEDLAKLQEVYRGIGLTELAEAVADSNDLSLVGLTRLIARHSDYTFNMNLPKRYFHENITLESFAQYVSGSRLQVQCTGASSFLTQSLNIALPGSINRQISGLVLGQGDRISQLGHAQTMVSYGGRQYILDPTPPSTAGYSFGRGGVYGGQWDEYSQRDRPENTSEGKPSASNNEDSNVAVISLESLVAEHIAAQASSRRTQMERILKNVFEVVNDEQLYKKVLSLRPHDPVRRTVEAVLRYDIANQESVDAIGNTAQYLSNYSVADDATLRRLSLPKYDPDLLALLTQTLLG